MMLDQQDLIKKLLIYMNEMKILMNMSPPLIEQEIDEMMDTSRYAIITKIYPGAGTGGANVSGSGVGGSGVGGENLRGADNLNLYVDLDGAEVHAGIDGGGEKGNVMFNWWMKKMASNWLIMNLSLSTTK